MKYNYQLIIEYLGTSFAGWQIQKNEKTIQGVIQIALSKAFNSKIKVIGAGRTDAGVHALGQSANFFLNNKIKNIPKTISTINFFLKNYSISIINLKKRNVKFHSRHSAKKRLYEYVIINRHPKLAIENDKAWLVKKKLNLVLMQKAIKFLTGTHDFSTYRSSSCGAKSPIKNIIQAKVSKSNNKIIIRFLSKSFLQQQVRSMVGCLKFVGEEKWNIKKFKTVLKSKKRSLCAPPAPAEGLFLKRVFY